MDFSSVIMKTRLNYLSGTIGYVAIKSIMNIKWKIYLIIDYYVCFILNLKIFTYYVILLFQRQNLRIIMIDILCLLNFCKKTIASSYAWIFYLINLLLCKIAAFENARIVQNFRLSFPSIFMYSQCRPW